VVLASLTWQSWECENWSVLVSNKEIEMDTKDLFLLKKQFEARLLSLENDVKRAFLPMADVAYAPFPVAMYSFATVDYFSSFWAGWNDIRNRPRSDRRSQTKRMADFLEKYLIYPQKESQLAVTIWRHKLMHTAEPRELANEDGKTHYGWSISDQDERHWELVAEADGTVREREASKAKFGGHTIGKAEIEELAKTKPETVIVGTGTSGMATVSPDARLYGRESKLNLVVLPSSEAIAKLNQLMDEGKRVAALIHITC